MQIKIALRKTSLIDYPGCISSVIFFPGCNLRCPWCHNRDLVLGNETKDLVPLEEGLAHLLKRQSVLGGVVLSGGEPCIHAELPGIIEEIKKLSLKVKLDTNGMFPAVLEKLFSRKETLPDYIALDLKIAPRRYSELKSREPDDTLSQSAALINNSGIFHEYRTLALPGGFITENDIEALAPLTDDSPWYFRPFRAGNCLDPSWDSLEKSTAEAVKDAKALAEKAKKLGKTAFSA